MRERGAERWTAACAFRGIHGKRLARCLLNLDRPIGVSQENIPAPGASGDRSPSRRPGRCRPLRPTQPAGRPGATLRPRSSRLPLPVVGAADLCGARPASLGLDVRPLRLWPRRGSGRCAVGRGKVGAPPARRQPGEERDSSVPEVRLLGQPRASVPVAGGLHGLAELLCVCVVRRAPRTEENESRDTTRGP